MNKIKGGTDKDEWMDPMVRQTLQEKWDADEYKKKSEQNKKNCASESGGSLPHKWIHSFYGESKKNNN